MSERPCYYRDVETCVEETLSKVGRRIALGSPLGLGKANHLINEFVRRAREDSSIDLHIFTALTLTRPRWKNELERRFIGPLSERLFGGYPELDYVDLIMKRDVPENIRVSEFYFQPGSFLDSPLAQQSYMSSNYTHVVRDVLDAGINVLVQLVAKDEEHQTRYSLSCNPDLTLDLVPHLRRAERQGAKIALLAQVNPNLPFMYGDASVASDYFDAIVDDPKYTFPLFGPPNRTVDTVEYLIASEARKEGGKVGLARKYFDPRRLSQKGAKRCRVSKGFLCAFTQEIFSSHGGTKCDLSTFRARPVRFRERNPRPRRSLVQEQ